MPITQDRFLAAIHAGNEIMRVVDNIISICARIPTVQSEINSAIARNSHDETLCQILANASGTLGMIRDQFFVEQLLVSKSRSLFQTELSYYRRFGQSNVKNKLRAERYRRDAGIAPKGVNPAEYFYQTGDRYDEHFPQASPAASPELPSGINAARFEEIRKQASKRQYYHGEADITPENPYGFPLGRNGEPYEQEQEIANDIADLNNRPRKDIIRAKYAEIGVYPRDFSQVIAQSLNPQASPTQALQASPNHMPETTSEPKLYVDPLTGEPEPRLVKREGEIIGEYSSEPKKLFPGAIFGKPPVPSTSEPEAKAEATNEQIADLTDEEIAEGRTYLHERIWKEMTNGELLASFRNNMSLWPGLSPEAALAQYLEQFRNKDEDGTGKNYAADLL